MVRYLYEYLNVLFMYRTLEEEVLSPLARRHISPEARIRHFIEDKNFEDEKMRTLGKTGSIEAIRQHAVTLAPAVPVETSDPTEISEPPFRTREERLALQLIDTIDTLARIESKLQEEAARRPARSLREMDGVTPLTRATFEGGRENL